MHDDVFYYTYQDKDGLVHATRRERHEYDTMHGDHVVKFFFYVLCGKDGRFTRESGFKTGVPTCIECAACPYG